MQMNCTTKRTASIRKMNRQVRYQVLAANIALYLPAILMMQVWQCWTTKKLVLFLTKLWLQFKGHLNRIKVHVWSEKL